MKQGEVIEGDSANKINNQTLIVPNLFLAVARLINKITLSQFLKVQFLYVRHFLCKCTMLSSLVCTCSVFGNTKT